MINQQKTKNVKLTNKELDILLGAIDDSLFMEEEIQNTILEDLQELIPEKSRIHDKKMLAESKERVKILEDIRGRFNALSWEL